MEVCVCICRDQVSLCESVVHAVSVYVSKFSTNRQRGSTTQLLDLQSMAQLLVLNGNLMILKLLLLHKLDGLIFWGITAIRYQQLFTYQSCKR